MRHYNMPYIDECHIDDVQECQNWVNFDDLMKSEYLQDDLMMILEKCSKERHASEFTIFDNGRSQTENSF